MPLLPPTNVFGFPVGSDSIHVLWYAPPEESLNGILRYYLIHLFEEETSRDIFEPASNATYVSSLHPFYTYVIRVAAVTVGVGPFSSNITIRTGQDGEMVV